jgi:hypothetical protein
VGPQANLTISKSSSPNPYVPGAAELHRRGEQQRPSDATNARVQDALPAALAGFGWTCAPSGAGPSCGTARARQHRRAGDAAVGNERDVHGERDGAGGNAGQLINTATVTPPLG